MSRVLIPGRAVSRSSASRLASLQDRNVGGSSGKKMVVVLDTCQICRPAKRRISLQITSIVTVEIAGS